MVDGVDVPVIASIFDNNVWTLSVTLSWLPVAPDATKEIGVPSTVMVSPGAKLACNESVPAAPDSPVAPVTAAGGTAWLLTALPVAVPVVLKKLSPAATAEAATSAVPASVPIAEVSAALRFAAVAVAFAPMLKLPDGGGELLEAVNRMVSVVPSGRLNAKLICSPGFGLPAVMSTDTEAGEPDGPDTTALVNDEDTPFSLNPNGEPATSSATFSEVVVGAEMTRR